MNLLLPAKMPTFMTSKNRVTQGGDVSLASASPRDDSRIRRRQVNKTSENSKKQNGQLQTALIQFLSTSFFVPRKKKASISLRDVLDKGE